MFKSKTENKCCINDAWEAFIFKISSHAVEGLFKNGKEKSS